MQKWLKTMDFVTVVSERTGGGGALYTASAAGCSRPCGARNLTSHHIVRGTVADLKASPLPPAPLHARTHTSVRPLAVSYKY